MGGCIPGDCLWFMPAGLNPTNTCRDVPEAGIVFAIVDGNAFSSYDTWFAEYIPPIGTGRIRDVKFSPHTTDTEVPAPGR
jgi:hypothetical protein